MAKSLKSAPKPSEPLQGAFIVFGFCTYYPAGGLDDVRAQVETFAAAVEVINQDDVSDEWQIMNRLTGETWTVEYTMDF